MNLNGAILTIFAAICLAGCDSKRRPTVAVESTPKPITAQQAYKDLFAMLGANEADVVKILHRNAPLLREDFEISPSRKVSWDGESRLWTVYTRYGFFGYAEASCDAFGGERKIKITNTEDKPNWTEFLVPAKNESQQDGGATPRRSS